MVNTFFNTKLLKMPVNDLQITFATLKLQVSNRLAMTDFGFDDVRSIAIDGPFDGQGDHHTLPAYLEKAFRKYLKCVIFVQGFARVHCNDFGSGIYPLRDAS